MQNEFSSRSSKHSTTPEKKITKSSRSALIDYTKDYPTSRSTGNRSNVRHMEFLPHSEYVTRRQNIEQMILGYYGDSPLQPRSGLKLDDFYKIPGIQQEVRAAKYPERARFALRRYLGTIRKRNPAELRYHRKSKTWAVALKDKTGKIANAALKMYQDKRYVSGTEVARMSRQPVSDVNHYLPHWAEHFGLKKKTERIKVNKYHRKVAVYR